MVFLAGKPRSYTVYIYTVLASPTHLQSDAPQTQLPLKEDIPLCSKSWITAARYVAKTAMSWAL